MNALDIDLLHTLIGRKVSWRGGSGVVVEILEDAPALVVQAESSMIQPDSFGYARRMSREIMVIRVFGPDGGYAQDFLEIAAENP